ncbi:TGS domain-containing protein [Candidatus Micrarchaeota archaeon]|nr:TGS domain-containing protein [Candidatus Micrarchaeota archaeon]
MASLNAGPEYYAAEEKYRQAKTTEDKLIALQEMLRLCPKHKSSESILLEIKGKLSKLRKEQLVEKRVKASKKGHGDFIRKQGAAQICLLGFANAGKTALFNALTSLKTPSTPVPFETQKAIPGMIMFEGIDLQILDLPSATDNNRAKLLSFARNADLNLVIIDPFQSVEQQKTFFGDAENAWYVISKKTLLSPESEVLQDSSLYSYDALSHSSVLPFKRMLVQKLDLIRIFTKSPRSGIDNNKPFVIRRGATVQDVAKQIHKEFYQNLKYAKVWGSAKFPGQQVSSDYVVHDRDILELHMK